MINLKVVALQHWSCKLHRFGKMLGKKKHATISGKCQLQNDAKSSCETRAYDASDQLSAGLFRWFCA